MNLNSLKSILEELKKEIDIKLIGTKEHELLCLIINDLEYLIRRLDNPEKTKKLEKLI